MPQQSGGSILQNLNQIREKMVNEGLNAEKIVILEMISKELKNKDPAKPVNLRQVERSKLRKVVSEVNDVLAYINTKTSVRSIRRRVSQRLVSEVNDVLAYINTIADTNKLLNAAAIVVEKRLGIKRRTTQ